MKQQYSLLILLSAFLISSCKKDNGDSSGPLIERDFPVVIELPDAITESSGIIQTDPGFLWTHNDSGDEPQLYKVSLGEVSLEATVQINNASHEDWEAITEDANHVYIGDFGNNGGNRTDLVIYKIAKTDLQTQNTVDAEAIEFDYADQTNFEVSSKHNYDAEAIISLGDELIIFTKNRGNLQTHLYPLPKVAGTYTVTQQDAFDVDGLITAAAINSSKDLVCLLGYNITDNIFDPFVWLLYDFTGTNILSGKQKRVELDLQRQTEGICFKNDRELYFTTEEESGTPAFVYLFDAGEWIE